VEPPPVEPPPVEPSGARVEPAARVAAPYTPPAIEIHGFVSQGAFVSTANDYLGRSSRGSLELFEAALNVSTEVTDRLRAGVQLFSRNVGDFDDLSPRLDWAFLDYRWKDWLGVRAGIIKMPFGLYNEFTDIDAARLPILMPQGVYPLRNRDVFLSHTGFAAYGAHPIGSAGALEAQVWLGTLTIPRNALVLTGATLDSIDTRYVTGGQLFWYPPVDGLRLGGTFLRASIDFHLTLSPENVEALIMAGAVPPDYDGALVVSQRPTWAVIGSAEYVQGDWLFAAEYSRQLKHQQTSLPMVIPAVDEDAEAFYAMVTHRPWSRAEVGAYYSVFHADAGDRRGRGPQWPAPHRAFQRDLAATIQLDINERWLWKMEAHFIDGTADLPGAVDPARYWGLFLLRTTVTF
jgi:hypothetical protein